MPDTVVQGVSSFSSVSEPFSGERSYNTLLSLRPVVQHCSPKVVKDFQRSSKQDEYTGARANKQDASIIIELQPSTLDSLAMACSTAVCLRAKRHMLAAVSRTSAAMREPRAFHYQAVKPVESCEHTCTSKTAEDQSTAC